MTVDLYAILLLLGAMAVCLVRFLIVSRKRESDLLRQIDKLKTKLYLERNKEMMEFIKSDRTREILLTAHDVGQQLAVDYEAAVLNQVFGGGAQ